MKQFLVTKKNEWLYCGNYFTLNRKMKFEVLVISFVDIEGFLYVNFIPFLIFLSIAIFVVINYRLYFNFKKVCPKCGSSSDISRIKRNPFFKKIGFSEAYKKYTCKKCHYKFYIFNKNIKTKEDVI